MTEERPPRSGDVAELLRQRLESASEVLRVEPPPAHLLQQVGIRRRRRRRIGQSLVAVATTAGATGAIVILAGVAPHPSKTAPMVTPASPRSVLTIPWGGHVYHAPKKAPNVSRDPSLAPSSRFCSANALQVTGEFEPAPATSPTGTVQARVVAKNISSEPCELTGEVFTRVLSGSGRVLVKGEVSDMVAHVPQPALLPGATASTTVDWVSWCGAPVSGWNLLVSVGQPVAHAYVPVPLPSSPPPPTCQHRQSAIGGGLWTVLNSFGQPKLAPAAVLEARIEQGTIDSRAGDVFDFSVVVSNPSRGPVTLPLHPCPYYATGMNSLRHPRIESLAGQMYFLNCKAMPRTLRPGESLRLLMRMRVPTSDDLFGPNRPGGYDFYWTVPDWSLQSQHVRLVLH